MATRGKGKKKDARDFFRELKQQAEPAPFYLLFGEEGFLLDLALQAVIKKVLPGGFNDFNFDQFYGKEVVGDKVVSACDTLALMGGRRLVMVKDIATVPTAQLHSLATYLKNPSPATSLVCHGLTVKKKLNKNTTFWKTARKAGVVQEFPTLQKWEVGTFLKRQANKRGLQLGSDSENALIDAVGTDLGTLDTSLEKIDLYMGPSEETRRVDLETLETIIATTRTREIWDLTEAIGARNLTASITLLHTMLDQGQSGVGINMMVARHFRQLFQVKAAVALGLDNRETASRAGMSPYAVDKFRKGCKPFSQRGLRRIMEIALRTDRSLKSSRLSDKILLEQMILEVCAGNVGSTSRR